MKDDVDSGTEIITGPLGTRRFCPYDNIGNTRWVYQNICLGDTYLNEVLLTPEHPRYQYAMSCYKEVNQ